MSRRGARSFLLLAVSLLPVDSIVAQPVAEPPSVRTDRDVKYDYDIVYVRAPRRGDEQHIAWAEVFAPLRAEPGSDLVLLHPDGSEEVLVAAGDDAITDPVVSFDAQWVYYARYRNVRPSPSERPTARSADICKIHLKSRKVIQVTDQAFSPNTGVVAPKLRSPGVFNLGPCPLPGGRLMFTSNRNGFSPSKDYRGLAASNDYFTTTMQLFVVDDPPLASEGQPVSEANLETIGHLNMNGALHPTLLKDGRVMFSSFETQGLRDFRMWAIWTIHPDGTGWAPLVSALGPSGETAYHFMTQLADEHVVFTEYYFQHDFGFGTFYKLAVRAPQGQPFFGPGSPHDPRNLKYGNAAYDRFPFSPRGLEWLTPFALAVNSPARHPSLRRDPKAPHLGRVTHPSGAPDNHLLMVYSPGPVHRSAKPAVDSGIYLMKGGKAIDSPGQMLLIKNDPKVNEQWPRAVVPYRRIHGVDEPLRRPPTANDRKETAHLPAGSPFGLFGASSLYKRESYPLASVPDGKVTSAYAGGDDPFEGLGSLSFRGIFGNWFIQGADAGRYANSDIHAIRILATEPTTHPDYTGQTRRWWNAANERFRILGEFPVRHFENDKQPLDPDGNPDTSFLVKLPADVAWTLQTLDRRGMVLNMAQTWHQLRPGEMRTNCGGCHAHSQAPTSFADTRAARADSVPFDVTRQTPLLTTKAHDASGRQWDAEDTTGLRYAKNALNVEYFRDVRPILERSCVACHTQASKKPAGNLVLDDTRWLKPDHGFGPLLSGPPGDVPATYARLALDPFSKFGHRSPVGVGPRAMWPLPQASRYVRYLQSRRSLLIWKVYGERLDGFKNEDFAHEMVPGDPTSLVYQGKPYKVEQFNQRLINLAYSGGRMPPPEAVAGTFLGEDGKAIKVPPLSDEDRLTLVRWIDLGCPIDFAFDPAHPEAAGRGWLEDDSRPTLTVMRPQPGANSPLTGFVIGMFDYESGLDQGTFTVTADVPIDGIPAGEDLAPRFKATSTGVWEMALAKAVTELARGRLFVSVRDRHGNLTKVDRTFHVSPKGIVGAH